MVLSLVFNTHSKRSWSFEMMDRSTIQL